LAIVGRKIRDLRGQESELHGQRRASRESLYRARASLRKWQAREEDASKKLRRRSSREGKREARTLLADAREKIAAWEKEVSRREKQARSASKRFDDVHAERLAAEDREARYKVRKEALERKIEAAKPAPPPIELIDMLRQKLTEYRKKLIAEGKLHKPSNQRGFNDRWQTRSAAKLGAHRNMRIGIVLMPETLDIIVDKVMEAVEWCRKKLSGGMLSARIGLLEYGSQLVKKSPGPEYFDDGQGSVSDSYVSSYNHPTKQEIREDVYRRLDFLANSERSAIFVEWVSAHSYVDIIKP